MAENTNSPTPESAHGDFQLSLGYAGVLRIRAAPRIRLTLVSRKQPALEKLDAWQVVVGGKCENVMDALPCRLQWLVTSDLFSDKVVAHPRETCIVPDADGKTFAVHEKDGEGTRPLRISVFELGLLGKGRLGYRLEPLLFGSEPVEVKPGMSEAIAYDLGVNLKYGPAPKELTKEWLWDWIEKQTHQRRVGSIVQFAPVLPRLFNGMLARLDIWPAPAEGEAPDEGATVHLEWEVGNPQAASQLLWRVGFMGTPEEGKCKALDQQLAVVGSVSPPPKLAFHYQLTLSPKPPPTPPDEKGKGKKPPPAAAAPTLLQSDPQFLFEVPRPRLKSFDLRFSEGKLSVEAGCENFSDSVQLDVVLKAYVREPISGEGDDTVWRVEELDDYVRYYLFPGVCAVPGEEELEADLVPPSLLDLERRASQLGAVVETFNDNKFKRVLMNLQEMPRAYLKAFERVKGLELFVTLQLSPSVSSRTDVSLHDFLEYEASDDQKKGGFAPIRNGQFVSKVFAPGVCSLSTVDVSGHARRLYSPLPKIPPERMDDFHHFVATVCGESIGQCEAAWKGVAHTIMNRVARKFEKWSEYLSTTEVINKSGFDGSKNDIHEYSLAFLKDAGAARKKYSKIPESSWENVKRILEISVPIFMERDGDGGGVVFFYSPKTQNALGRAPPSWIYQEGDKRLVRITDAVLGGAKDDFEFYAFKYPEKFPRMTDEEIQKARAARGKS
ncbi:cell wall hydrolase [Archangium violaceum]|uniref:hypothetical protein n=1 Tax=Archangium violaceum TaxID=83451 RepID=UPI002B2CB844|nr:cell wall hydrolase [Archangium violaceum]